MNPSRPVPGKRSRSTPVGRRPGKTATTLPRATGSLAPAVALLAATSPALGTAPDDVCGARLQGVFVESAPRDRFEFSHGSTEGWFISRLSLDLGGSTGRLLFDTEDGGEGVEVFQPLRVEPGPVRVRDIDLPADGEETLALDFATGGSGAFAAGESLVISIDVDDRLDASDLGQIRVSGAEIEGGRLSVELVHEEGVTERLAGYFDADARVELIGTPCGGEEDGGA